jgi:hypothetical protein
MPLPFVRKDRVGVRKSPSLLHHAAIRRIFRYELTCRDPAVNPP